jgi:DNA-binding CsgD family transcriptional regulator
MYMRMPAGFLTEERKPTYHIWRGMVRRCFSPLCAEYRFYGAKGVKVCDRWLHFPHFIEDMGLRPSGLSIDRIDPTGDYQPGNCRWATLYQQATENRRKRPVAVSGFSNLSNRQLQTATLLHRGLPAREIAVALGVSHQTARSYVKSLYKRVGTHNRAEIILWMERRNLAASPSSTTP